MMQILQEEAVLKNEKKNPKKNQLNNKIYKAKSNFSIKHSVSDVKKIMRVIDLFLTLYTTMKEKFGHILFTSGKI